MFICFAAEIQTHLITEYVFNIPESSNDAIIYYGVCYILLLKIKRKVNE